MGATEDSAESGEQRWRRQAEQDQIEALASAKRWQSELESAAIAGSLGRIEQALARGADPREGYSCALRFAGGSGSVECVRKLMAISDPTEVNSDALRRAAESGNAEIVRLLIPVSNPLDSGSEALTAAARKGSLECVMALLPVSDPLASNRKALTAALRGKSEACMAALLPVSDCDGVEAWQLMEWAQESQTPRAVALVSAYLEARELGACVGRGSRSKGKAPGL